MASQPVVRTRRPPAARPAALLVALLAALGGCAAGSSVDPPTPLSNVEPAALSPDGTFKKNGLVPVDPSEQF